MFLGCSKPQARLQRETPNLLTTLIHRAKVLHFLGQHKPWHWPPAKYQAETPNADPDVHSLLEMWWGFYYRSTR
jgi:hypothetical protein